MGRFPGTWLDEFLRLNPGFAGMETNTVELTAEEEAMLLEDLANSTELPGYSLEGQSWWERFKAHSASLLAPVL